MPLQRFFAIGIVEGAAKNAEENQYVSSKIAAAEIQTGPIDSGTHQHSQNGQPEANPADRSHVLTEQEVRHHRRRYRHDER